MPIYLCQPGISTSEPWRYGIQVYERPFPLNYNNDNNDDSQKSSGDDGTPSSTRQLQKMGGGGEKKKKDGPEQIIVMISNNNDDNDSYTEKFAALQRYLTEFASSTQDRVLVFCNNNNGHQKAHDIAKELDNANFKAVSLGDDNNSNDGIDVLPEELKEFLSSEEVGGKGGFNILVVDDSDEKHIAKKIITEAASITMVINFDFPSSSSHSNNQNDDSVQRYISRLQYTTKSVVTFFDKNDDNNKNGSVTQMVATELIHVLKNYGQKIPKELSALVVPPASEGGSSSSTAVMNNPREQRRPMMNAVPLRGDSHSPAPDGIGGGGGGGGGRQQRQLEYAHNMTMSNQSSDEEGYDDIPMGARHLPAAAATSTAVSSNHNYTSMNIRPNPIRRVRHAEVVLVDQALVAYGRTWLRLRWPGDQGGFGGFVALSRVEDMMLTTNHESDRRATAADGNVVVRRHDHVVFQDHPQGVPGASTSGSTTISAAASSTQTSLLCQETDTHYPTSKIMQLLPNYDDGLNVVVVDENEGRKEQSELDDDLSDKSLDNGEPVFCRICREGIHDVNYDLETVSPQQQQQQQQQSAATAGGGEAAVRGEQSAANVVADRAATAVDASSTDNAAGAGDRGGGLNSDSSDACTTNPRSALSHLANLPPVVLHHPTAENPLLAPCDCTGTMAFVHYLCIEQWRCRSRHPGARNGLNCETCSAEYTLPPPPTRPNTNRNDLNGGIGVGPNGIMGEDDWLQAMPPHVLAALRRPHPAWQLGAAVVRRRWLRPVVPILVSPLVALYCRARRTLKKRGVSRRRWACSLCRRRARWKCVRCLRSYYCSRQCQNVSWHIVHKHVCYKPVRYWWSVVVYTVGVCMTVPRLLENFPVYDAMVTLVPINFITLGISFGGIASTLKRSSGIDIRGRILEIIVVALTLLLTCVTSGLVRGFFGDACWGMLAPSQPEQGACISSKLGIEECYEDVDSSLTLHGPFYPAILNKVLLDVPFRQLQLWYIKWDFVVTKLGFVSTRFLCFPTEDGNTDYENVGCSPHIRKINPQFYSEPSCSADLSLIMGVWFAALGVLLMGNLARQLRGVRAPAAAAQRGRRGRPHQHQD